MGGWLVWFTWGGWGCWVTWELKEGKKRLSTGQIGGGGEHGLNHPHPFPFHVPTSIQSYPILSFPLLYCAILYLFHSTLYPVPFYPPVSLHPNLLFSILIVLLILRCSFSSYTVPSHLTLFLLIIHCSSHPTIFLLILSCSFSSYIVPSHPTVQWSNSFISFSNYLFQIFYISVQLKRTMSYFNLNCSLSSYSVSFRRILILHLSFI